MANGVRKALSALINRAKSLSMGMGDNPTAMAKMNARIARIGFTSRQRELNDLWMWFRNQHHEGFGVDWNGDQIPEIEIDTYATQAYVPPGQVAMAAETPIKYRRPTAPYALPRVIVKRFTGLLFSEGHQPKIVVEGDSQTDDWINAAMAAGNLWSKIKIARDYGGAMGTTCLGFKFLPGDPGDAPDGAEPSTKIEIEVHNPCWCVPTFKAHGSFELLKLEKRYLTPKEERDERTGKTETVWFWYRRVIDEQTDTEWELVPVGDLDEPAWDDLPHETITHGFGFVPAVWTQNKPVEDDIDGDPDCVGIFDLVDSIDRLVSQSNKSALANADPTPVFSTDAILPKVKMGGADTGIKLPTGDSASFLESSGAGAKAALDLAKELRAFALEVAQCVLDHPEANAQKTATEIERVYSSMLEAAGDMRTQYGDCAIVPLAQKMIRGARTLARGAVGSDGVVVHQEVRLPPRVIKPATDAAPVEGSEPPPVLVERALGPGGVVTLRWPPFFRPTLVDITQAVAAAAQALTAGLIDEDHAVDFVSRFFGFADTAAVRAKIGAEKAKRDAEHAAMVQRYMGGGR